MLIIWHNPRCAKSRQALALLEAASGDVTIRHYLDDVPNVAEIKAMIRRLGVDDPRDLMRRGERIYKDMGLKDVKNPDELLRAMAANPILIERPVVTNGEFAVIGRPPEAINSLI